MPRPDDCTFPSRDSWVVYTGSSATGRQRRSLYFHLRLDRHSMEKPPRTTTRESLNWQRRPNLLTRLPPSAIIKLGPEDLLEISVLEAPDLNRTVRVSDDGAISLALLGSIQAAGLSTRELQADLEDRLRHTYMKDPQVSVFVQEMRSHPVSVFGAVEKPGVYQIRYAKTLVEVLSMAQGLADDAGDTVIVVRHPGDSADPALASLCSAPNPRLATDRPFRHCDVRSPAHQAWQLSGTYGTESIAINLKDLLDSSNPRSNVLVYPGDQVKVSRAGIVYVVGQVHKPGGFLLKTNENISVCKRLPSPRV